MTQISLNKLYLKFNNYLNDERILGTFSVRAVTPCGVLIYLSMAVQ